MTMICHGIKFVAISLTWPVPLRLLYSWCNTADTGTYDFLVSETFA